MLDDSVADALEKKSRSFKKSSHGGARPGAGRRKGVPNKITQEIREIAGKHGEEAIRELVRVMKKGESEAARVSAAKEILDRAYGKSTQPIESGENPFEMINRITIEIVEPECSGSR